MHNQERPFERDRFYASMYRGFLVGYGALLVLAGVTCSAEFFERHVSPDGVLDPGSRAAVSAGRAATAVSGCLLIALGLRRRGGAGRGGSERAVKLGVMVTSALASLAVIEVGARFYVHSRYESLVEEAGRKRPESHAPDERIGLIDIITLSPDRGLVYEMRPGAAGFLSGARVEINAGGYRGTLYPSPKSGRSFRIVGLGDSVAFGLGVEVEDTFMHHLERLLVQAGCPCEVVNLSVPGYNTAMEVEMLSRRGLAYEPDLILLTFCANDFSLPNYLRKPPDVLTLKRSFAYEMLTRYKPLVKGFDIAPREGGNDRGDAESIPPEYHDMIGPAGVARALRRLRGIAGERGIRVIIGYYETLEASPGGGVGRESGVQRFLSGMCSELGFDYCDWTDALCRHAAATGGSFKDLFWVGKDDGHPSVLAHMLIAESLRDFILARGLCQQAARK